MSVCLKRTLNYPAAEQRGIRFSTGKFAAGEEI